MSALVPFLILDQPCDEVVAWVQHQLAGAGLHLVQTFDLQVAKLAHTDCPCPHHGTNRCNCQMIVLLVYRKRDDPASLIIHGQDGRTWLSLTGPVGEHANQRLEASVRHALDIADADAYATIEASHEA